jgi:dolichyl-diphosphooligosaccharide--protein glycosyltransferase
MIRHLADYVLIWTGGGGDDLAKSPHMVRATIALFNCVVTYSVGG